MDTICLIIGIVLSAIGLLMLASYLNAVCRRRTAVDAEITDIAVKRTPLRGTIVREYTPVFTYTFNGKSYTVRADVTTKQPGKYAVGQKALIHINPAHPEAVRCGSSIGILSAGLVLTAAGALFIVLFFV